MNVPDWLLKRQCAGSQRQKRYLFWESLDFLFSCRPRRSQRVFGTELIVAQHEALRTIAAHPRIFRTNRAQPEVLSLLRFSGWAGLTR